jgi:Acetyltransferase (GNAT) domain
MLSADGFEPSLAGGWDELVRRAPMGHMLHTRAFLSYHGDRFEDASLMLRDGRGRLVGVFPAARAGNALVASHPGATFGGIVHDGGLAGAAMLDAIGALMEHYGRLGYERLRYAPVPYIYHRQPSEDDVYALFRLGAERVRCNLACAVDLEAGVDRSARRRRGLSKARREGVEVVEGPELVEELWPVLETNLAERYDVRPVHEVEEMRLLVDRFPDEIAVLLGRHDGAAVAGVVLFDSLRVSHAQYIASSDAGRELRALDAVFDRVLTRAAERGARYFDFGTSSRDGGHLLNTGLYEFKASFGGGGVAYEHYELDLATPKPVAP